VELLNQSRTTHLEQSPAKSRDGRWAIYAGKHIVHTSSYPFKVLYFNASANLDDIAAATRELRDREETHIVYAPSLSKFIKNNTQLPGLRSRLESLWDTKEYITSFIKDELEVYLNRLKELKPADYTNPKILTPAGFERGRPNPILSFLTDPTSEMESGKLGILLADPGQGKTYMSNYLVSQLAAGQHGVFPLMVDSSQWQGLSLNDQKSLTKTIAHSFRHFGAAIGWVDGHEDLFLKATLKADIFRIVFDGFDEYVLHNKGTVQPLDVLESLAELAKSTGTRIVITSRTSFWKTNLPQDEVDVFVKDRGAYVFSILPFDRENAKNYFDGRLPDDSSKAKALQTYNILYKASPDLIGRGFALSLIADLAARGGTSPHPGYDSSRAMLWLIDALCQREIARQELPFSAGEQLEILRQFASEIATGQEPNTDLLSLILSVVKPTLDSRSTTGTIEKLMSHPLLSKDQSRDIWSFRQEQIRILLLADELVHASSPDGGRFAARAKISPGERQDLGEMIVELILMEAAEHNPIERLSRLIRAMSTLHFKEREYLSSANQGARLAAVVALAAVEKSKPSGTPRAERTSLLKQLLDGGPLSGLEFSGTIARYDFCGSEFRNCRFDRVSWADCRFDELSSFVGCEFAGGTSVHCEGLGTVRMLDCKLDPEADATFNLARVKDGKRRYSVEDLQNDIMYVIDKFIIKGGVGLKSVEHRNLSRGVIASSNHRNEVVDAISSQLLEEHHISGAVECPIFCAVG
jgi:hypothetical protein